MTHFSHFSWSSLRCFYILIGVYCTCAKLNWLSMIWKRRTPFDQEVEETARRAQRQDCVEAQIWGRLQKDSAALKVPKRTLHSSKNGRSLKHPGFHLHASQWGWCSWGCTQHFSSSKHDESSWCQIALFWSHLTTSPSPKPPLDHPGFFGKLQTGLYMCLLQQRNLARAAGF